jgi:serine/threonine-protein kinase HipA
MRVGLSGTDSNLENALSQHTLFGLNRTQAEAQVRLVATVVEGWKPQFAAAGLNSADIESLAQQIDRPFLRDQRKAWVARA